MPRFTGEWPGELARAAGEAKGENAEYGGLVMLDGHQVFGDVYVFTTRREAEKYLGSWRALPSTRSEQDKREVL